MSHSPSLSVNSLLNSVEITPGKQHKLLAADRRRIALDVLDEQRESIALSQLAEEIARREEGTTAVKRVAISLHHVHLPLMTDMALIHYDATRNEIHPVE